MERGLKIVAVTIGVAAVSVLFIFGFAIWVFIPLLPAAIVYLIALCTARRTAALRPKDAEEEKRKAA